MKYVFDIDGTICTQTLDYKNARAFYDRISKVNSLFENGHIIWFFTARGSETRLDWYDMTKDQLKQWGVKYHKLLFGKPSADKYIDDKAIDAVTFFK